MRPECTHPSEETFEEYIFDRLPETQVTFIEEHLLLCVTCQRVLEELDEYILLIKAATAECTVGATLGRDRRAALVPLWLRIVNATSDVLLTQKGAWAAAALVLIVGLGQMGIDRSRPSPERASTIELAAFRGGGPGTDGLGPARKPLDLSIDASDLPPAADYRIEIVDATGSQLWNGGASSSGGKLSAHVSPGFRPGAYWVRLSASNAGDSVKLLREFGLRLQ